MFQRILVPLDGSRFGEHALPRARAIASRNGATLDLAMVAEPAGGSSAPGTVPGEDSQARGEKAAAEYLAEVEERVRGAGFAGSVERTVLSPGNVASSLVRHLRGTGADLAVMTTHGRGPVRRAWLGSTADGFIRSTPAPVLLVRPEGDAETERVDPGPAFPLEPKILVPLDGSPSGERLLDFVEPLAGTDASVTLLRVVPPFTTGGSPYLPHLVRDEQEHQKVKEAAGSYLEGLASGLEEAGFDVESAVVTSSQPAMAILEAVEARAADLVAMSTSGRGGVTRFVLGSVADKVIRGASVPVLLYRKPEEE